MLVWCRDLICDRTLLRTILLLVEEGLWYHLGVLRGYVVPVCLLLLLLGLVKSFLALHLRSHIVHGVVQLEVGLLNAAYQSIYIIDLLWSISVMTFYCTFFVQLILSARRMAVASCSNACLVLSESEALSSLQVGFLSVLDRCLWRRNKRLWLSLSYFLGWLVLLIFPGTNFMTSTARSLVIGIVF